MNPEMQEYPRSRLERLWVRWFPRFIAGAVVFIVLAVWVRVFG